MAKADLTAARLRELLAYNADTGVFTWLDTRSSVKAGEVAGSNKDGYVKIKILGRLYGAHRLAWFQFHGHWPLNHVDHIDGNPSNNAIVNLRDVTCSVNQQNQRRPQGSNTSGFLGVSRKCNGWMAQIQTNGKKRYLGTHATPDVAYAAYLEAKRLLHDGNML